MKILKFSILFSFLVSQTVFANPKLQTLLNKIKDEQSQDSKLWQAREAEFEASEAEQKKLLQNAELEFKKVQDESLKLSKAFESNEKKLQVLEERKNQVMGAFGELYGSLRQTAGDFNTLILNSATSAQKPERFVEIQKLAKTNRLPEFSELEYFWFLLQEEMTLQSQTSVFKSNVINEKGLTENLSVVRLGSFNIYTGNEYLNFDIKNKSIQFYPRQPERAYTKHLDDFAEASQNSLQLVSLDPSKGALLETLIEAPTFLERVHQGGLVGYVILVLMFLGFVIGGERLLYYHNQEKQMKLQLKQINRPIPGNPLASLIEVYNLHKNDKDSEVLSLKLSEVILKEKPILERGLSTIKTFAGVAPLLGLLGTVTGMILTFQTITMFGSGDPKLMAGGISQALVTTVQGLVCAIPLLVVYNYVNTKYLNIITFLSQQVAGMMAEVEIESRKTKT